MSLAHRRPGAASWVVPVLRGTKSAGSRTANQCSFHLPGLIFQTISIRLFPSVEKSIQAERLPLQNCWACFRPGWPKRRVRVAQSRERYHRTVLPRDARARSSCGRVLSCIASFTIATFVAKSVLDRYFIAWYAPVGITIFVSTVSPRASIAWILAITCKRLCGYTKITNGSIRVLGKMGIGRRQGASRHDS